MPPKRPQRKAAIEAKARFGSEKNRSARRGAGQGSPADGGTEESPPGPTYDDDGQRNPNKAVKDDMNREEPPVEAEAGAEVKPDRQNEGEASTAPVPEKVRPLYEGRSCGAACARAPWPRLALPHSNPALASPQLRPARRPPTPSCRAGLHRWLARVLCRAQARQGRLRAGVRGPARCDCQGHRIQRRAARKLRTLRRLITFCIYTLLRARGRVRLAQLRAGDATCHLAAQWPGSPGTARHHTLAIRRAGGAQI